MLKHFFYEERLREIGLLSLERHLKKSKVKKSASNYSTQSTFFRNILIPLIHAVKLQEQGRVSYTKFSFQIYIIKLWCDLKVYLTSLLMMSLTAL